MTEYLFYLLYQQHIEMQLHLSIYLSEILHLDGKEDIKITGTMCLNDKLIKNILVGML